MRRAKQSLQDLARFRAAADVSDEAIYVVDRATLRVVDATACAARRTGLSHEALLQKSVPGLLVRGGKAVGVLLLYSGEKDAFDDEIVSLLQRMARNLTFALDNIDHENERRAALGRATRGANDGLWAFGISNAMQAPDGYRSLRSLPTQ